MLIKVTTKSLEAITINPIEFLVGSFLFVDSYVFQTSNSDIYKTFSRLFYTGKSMYGSILAGRNRARYVTPLV